MLARKQRRRKSMQQVAKNNKNTKDIMNNNNNRLPPSPLFDDASSFLRRSSSSSSSSLSLSKFRNSFTKQTPTLLDMVPAELISGCVFRYVGPSSYIYVATVSRSFQKLYVRSITTTTTSATTTATTTLGGGGTADEETTAAAQQQPQSQSQSQQPMMYTSPLEIVQSVDRMKIAMNILDGRGRGSGGGDDRRLRGACSGVGVGGDVVEKNSNGFTIVDPALKKKKMKKEILENDKKKKKKVHDGDDDDPQQQQQHNNNNHHHQTSSSSTITTSSSSMIRWRGNCNVPTWRAIVDCAARSGRLDVLRSIRKHKPHVWSASTRTTAMMDKSSSSLFGGRRTNNNNTITALDHFATRFEMILSASSYLSGRVGRSSINNNHSHPVLEAAKGGHVHIIEWFYEEWKKSKSANSNSNVEEEDGKNKDKDHNRIASSKSGPLPGWFHLRNDQICVLAATFGHLNVIDYAKENLGHSCKPDKIISTAALHGHNYIIEWTFEKYYRRNCGFGQGQNQNQHQQLNVHRYYRQTKGWVENAAKMGHLSTLQCLRQISYNWWDKQIWKNAAVYGHVHILRWMRNDLGLAWDPRTCKRVAQAGKLEILQWVLRNGGGPPTNKVTSSSSVCAAIAGIIPNYNNNNDHEDNNNNNDHDNNKTAASANTKSLVLSLSLL